MKIALNFILFIFREKKYGTAYCITNINKERIEIYATKYIKSVLLIIYIYMYAPAKIYHYTCKYKFHVFIKERK